MLISDKVNTYDYDEFSEVCESVLQSVEHDCQVAVTLHAAAVTSINSEAYNSDNESYEYIVTVARASEDAYSLELFRYPNEDERETFLCEMYDSFDDARARYVALLNAQISER